MGERHSIADLKLNVPRFVKLLSSLVGEARRLQNRPPELIPTEDSAGDHIVAALEAHTVDHGGPLVVKRVSYVPGRGNIILEYPSHNEHASHISFVGAHMDVVYADEKNWSRDPFALTVDGDTLYGRGTTDCLGHCALLTDFFLQLAETKPKLNVHIVAVLIADEEAGSGCVGVEMLHKDGLLEKLKDGPVIWLDCADKQPNIGSGGVVGWRLTAVGKLVHSGFPHKGINAIELANDAMLSLQQQFYAHFPPHEREAEYGFECSSSFKPTYCHVPKNSINQIPAKCVLEGDIRLIPFYSILEAQRVIENAVKSLNDNLASVGGNRGPDAAYTHGEHKGSLQLEWTSPPIQGLACDLTSKGFTTLAQATEEVIGKVTPIADTGALPLVADLQRDGFDIQTIGFGVEDAYHADNEFARISDFKQGFQVMVRVVQLLNQGTP